ncbi:hypothetical protein [Helicobacter sp. 16-1353]|uniref:hypothetical protein n=1 Tax=Helicobacter sp. 16-1353 TaxID=2004996 RepID=UPI0011BFE288|nr:hypothetical protein [Helicobacter sp. 16-1353]
MADFLWVENLAFKKLSWRNPKAKLKEANLKRLNRLWNPKVENLKRANKWDLNVKRFRRKNLSGVKNFSGERFRHFLKECFRLWKLHLVDFCVNLQMILWNPQQVSQI